MSRLFLPALVASMIALAAVLTLIHDGGEPRAWQPDALAVADDVTARLRAAGIPCDEYLPYDFEEIATSYRGRLPLPAALTECVTDREEHLELAVFRDAKGAAQFVDAKRQLLCERAVARNFRGFPGFPYVDGGSWIVQPDEPATASRLAQALGASRRQASCSSSPLAAATSERRGAAQ